MSAIRTVHVRISGLVQGVGFRAWTERQAAELGLSGWVRNRPDRDVEALFCGPTESVEAMLAVCRQGPRHSRVDALEVLDEAAAVAGPFTIRAD